MKDGSQLTEIIKQAGRAEARSAVMTANKHMYSMLRVWIHLFIRLKKHTKAHISALS